MFPSLYRCDQLKWLVMVMCRYVPRKVCNGFPLFLSLRYLSFLPVQMDNKKKEILEALEQHNGIVSTACNNIGLARSTFYLWLKDDEEFKKAVDEIQEVAIDYVESKLFEKINGVTVKGKGSKVTEDGEDVDVVYEIPPSDTAIIFYLKTKGKKRGYVERQEIEHSGGLGITLIEGEADDKDEPITD